jgi:hypothetical protein
MGPRTARTKTSVTNTGEKREAIRSAIRAAHGHPIANRSAEAMRTLAGLEKPTTSYDHELKALYLRAYAIAELKVSFKDAFKSFDNALRLAQNRNESRLPLQILNNDLTSLVQVDEIDLAIDYLGESLTRQRREGAPDPSGPVASPRHSWEQVNSNTALRSFTSFSLSKCMLNRRWIGHALG